MCLVHCLLNLSGTLSGTFVFVWYICHVPGTLRAGYHLGWGLIVSSVTQCKLILLKICGHIIFCHFHHIHIRAGEHLHDCQVHYTLIEQTPLTEDRPICTSYQLGATYNKVLQKGLRHYISTTGCDVVVTLYCMLNCCTLYYRDCQCNKGELEHSVTTTGCDDKGL